MHTRFTSMVVLWLGLVLAPWAQAQVANCKPAKDCSSKTHPCAKAIPEGSSVGLVPSPVAGTPVIRVRVCGPGVTDVCPGGAAATQQVRVYGYDKNRKEIYAKSLDLAGQGQDSDTGAYTEVKNLTRLSVRCTSSSTSYCQVAWQLCRKALPVAGG